MEQIFGMVGVGCIVAAVVVIGVDRWWMKRVMNSLEGMLERAINGTFTVETLEETMVSKVEYKLWRYLTVSEISAGNVAREKDRIKELVSDISHQTKTPVANMLLYCELLREKELEGEAGEQVEALYAQAEKLEFLIGGLVKLSRLETGILTLHPVLKGVMPMLEGIEEEFLPKAAEKGLEMILEPTDAKAVFDEKWTAEAVANIVDNAIKYTERGTVHIRVIAYEMFVCIEVADTGSGIPEEEQAKVFARFYRSASSAEKEGVGIGLYLARQIIAGENGYIKVTSKKGEGSSFFVYLPVE